MSCIHAVPVTSGISYFHDHAKVRREVRGHRVLCVTDQTANGREGERTLQVNPETRGNDEWESETARGEGKRVCQEGGESCLRQKECARARPCTYVQVLNQISYIECVHVFTYTARSACFAYRRAYRHAYRHAKRSCTNSALLEIEHTQTCIQR